MPRTENMHKPKIVGQFCCFCNYIFTSLCVPKILIVHKMVSNNQIPLAPHSAQRNFDKLRLSSKLIENRSQHKYESYIDEAHLIQRE